MNTKRDNNQAVNAWAASEKAIGHYFKGLKARKGIGKSVIHGRGVVHDGCQCAECKAAPVNHQWTPSPEYLNAQALAAEMRKAKREADAQALYEERDRLATTVAWCLRKRNGDRVFRSKRFFEGLPSFLTA